MTAARPFQLLAIAAFLALIAPATAGPRTGFKKFAANYDGGYNVNGPELQSGGASKIVFRSSRNGGAALLRWKNTFYNEVGARSNVRTVWRFLPDGTFTANTIDPTRRGLSATGTYVLKNRRVFLDVTSGDTSMSGTVRLVGGGALEITAQVIGNLVEFHGGRK
ncbi:MAG: hypothetical protein WA771_10860 [Chthoniobacterales bacterium]